MLGLNVLGVTHVSSVMVERNLAGRLDSACTTTPRWPPAGIRFWQDLERQAPLAVAVFVTICISADTVDSVDFNSDLSCFLAARRLAAVRFPCFVIVTILGGLDWVRVRHWATGLKLAWYHLDVSSLWSTM